MDVAVRGDSSRRAAAKRREVRGVPSSGDWRKRLRHERRQLGLTREQLAERCGLSKEAIRGYEDGRRRPKREHLAQVLNALKLDSIDRRQVMVDAGFAPDTRVDAELLTENWHTVESAIAECQRHAWPAFVLDEIGDIAGANAAYEALTGLDLSRGSRAERNAFALASMPSYADHLVNFDDSVSVILGVFKSSRLAPEDLRRPGPRFKDAIARFAAGDPKYVQRVGEIWERTPIDWARKEHWSYPVVWRHAPGVIMRFESLVTTASIVDELLIIDWIPVDAKTWRALERITKAPAGKR